MIPADTLPDVLSASSDSYNGVDLLNDCEMDGLKKILASSPGIQVTPQILLQLVAERARRCNTA